MDFKRENKMCSFCGVVGSGRTGLNGGLGAMICDQCVEDFHRNNASEAIRAEKSAAPPWDTMSDADLIATLPKILQSAEQNLTFAQEWVDLLRSRRISWAEIGKALGVSRQAAWERFAGKVGKTSASA